MSSTSPMEFKPYPPSAVGKGKRKINTGVFLTPCVSLDIRNWSKDDVASWLEDNGFGEHKFIFIMNDITG